MRITAEQISDEYFNEDFKLSFDQLAKSIYAKGIKRGLSANKSWNRKTGDGWENEPPVNKTVIVSIHDDSGNAYTTSGWYFDGRWIVDNELCDYVVAWQEFPEPCKD